MPAKFVKIFQENRKYFASISDGPTTPGPKFYVGTKVAYLGNFGLNNLSPGQQYDPADYRAEHGFWADFIYPTVQCESKGYFHCLNTYDQAFFTFSFLQYGAHVPNGDFVQFFRQLLATPAGSEYFPDLVLKDGAIHRQSLHGLMRLETDVTTQPLMRYLNPTINEVEELEAINAAKFVHWSDNDPAHRKIQVDVGISVFKKAMKIYANKYALNGVLDKVCLVVADIRHQGRGDSASIINALNTHGDMDAAYNNLLKIGQQNYQERINTLSKTVKDLLTNGTLGQRRYDTATGDFTT